MCRIKTVQSKREARSTIKLLEGGRRTTRQGRTNYLKMLRERVRARDRTKRPLIGGTRGEGKGLDEETAPSEDSSVKFARTSSVVLWYGKFERTTILRALADLTFDGGRGKHMAYRSTRQPKTTRSRK